MISHQVLSSSKMWVTLVTLSVLLTTTSGSTGTTENVKITENMTITIHGTKKSKLVLKQNKRHAVRFQTDSNGLRHIRLSYGCTKVDRFLAINTGSRVGFTVDFPHAFRRLVPEFVLTETRDVLTARNDALRLEVGGKKCQITGTSRHITVTYQSVSVLSERAPKGHAIKKKRPSQVADAYNPAVNFTYEMSNAVDTITMYDKHIHHHVSKKSAGAKNKKNEASAGGQTSTGDNRAFFSKKGAYDANGVFDPNAVPKTTDPPTVPRGDSSVMSTSSHQRRRLTARLCAAETEPSR
jgi:hypothetical protein